MRAHIVHDCTFPAISPRFGVDLRASSSDKRLRVSVSSGGTVRVAGRALGAGDRATELRFDFPFGRVRLPLTRGTTPAQVVAALERALPAGLKLISVPQGRTAIVFGVVSQPGNDPEEISRAFRAARAPKSRAGEKVALAELRSIVKRARLNGLTDLEKQRMAMEWASLFDGAGFHATQAAVREFERLARDEDLPTFPVF